MAGSGIEGEGFKGTEAVTDGALVWGFDGCDGSEAFVEAGAGDAADAGTDGASPMARDNKSACRNGCRLVNAVIPLKAAVRYDSYRRMP